MKKEFFSDVQYNAKKRRSAIIMSVLLILFCAGFATFNITNDNLVIGVAFFLIALLPVFSIPLTFKNYKVDGKPSVIIDDDEVIVNGKTLKIKELLRIAVIVQIPASKIDSENVKLLNELQTAKPELDDFGSLDFYIKNEKGKTEALYTNVHCSVEALAILIKLGVKKYSLSYNIKNNTVKSEYDLKKLLINQEEKPAQKLSKKSKTKQLL